MDLIWYESDYFSVESKLSDQLGVVNATSHMCGTNLNESVLLKIRF